MKRLFRCPVTSGLLAATSAGLVYSYNLQQRTDDKSSMVKIKRMYTGDTPSWVKDQKLSQSALKDIKQRTTKANAELDTAVYEPSAGELLINFRAAKQKQIRSLEDALSMPSPFEKISPTDMCIARVLELEDVRFKAKQELLRERLEKAQRELDAHRSRLDV